MTEESFRLGSAGPTIRSPMGMGLWSWGDAMTWGYGSYDPALTSATMKGAYSACLAGGCNLFDTAESYGGGLWGGWGASERFLAACLKDSEQEAQPGPAPVVVSKYIPLPWRIREPCSTLNALQATVKRLDVDAVDLYLIHSPAATFNSIKTLASSLAAAVDSTQARHVGVSNYSAQEVRETHRVLAERGIPLAANQVEFSLLHALPDRGGLLDTCNELGVGLMAYSPLAMGRLTGKYSATNKPRGARRFGDVPFDQIQPLVDLLSSLGQVHGGKTPAQVALNWLICKGAVPIPGAKNADQAKANTGALGWRLSSGDVEELDGLALEGRLKFGQHG
ncbi:hypothetical protein D9Q98_001888 [Chlorella vulgaris]|uniref:NADP-dependent oxidoreductase domain-containing protein n=1 Tax=Chlorella vulgaris TaxID=3077 RepID=A0A9D4TVS7_CHLVU|nr:hypothetical protein D9Q98_001888 [Chlorella vulgaris]